MCGVPFQEEDVIILNGNKEDVEVLKKRMEDRRLKSKLEKKSKKCKSAGSASQQEASEDAPGPSKAMNGKDFINSSSGEKRQIVFTKSSGVIDVSSINSSAKAFPPVTYRNVPWFPASPCDQEVMVLPHRAGSGAQRELLRIRDRGLLGRLP
ncbi:hypothetical protein BTVI_38463 [Pitangus sulphuratus]|nr:hypothetical protein BTVI_38463 [Pitangus sulphuratus]